MKKILITIMLLMSSSCIHYSDVKGAMGNITTVGSPMSSSNFEAKGHLVNNSIKATKTGTACVNNVLMLVAIGDSSVEAAKNDGDITEVTFVDTYYKSFWFYYPFFQTGCTVVKGR